MTRDKTVCLGQAVQGSRTPGAGQRIATLTVIALVGALTLSACGSNGPAVSSSPAPSPTATSSPSTTPTPSGSSSADPCASPAKVAAIYYLDDVPTVGPRLYREFTLVPACAEPITEALTHMFQVPPVDPEYTSLWPTATEVLSVAISGSTATVDLSGFVQAGAAFETASVQQLVWTATAAEKNVKRIKLLVNGGPPPSGHSSWARPVGRASSLDTLANVWILQPTEGAEVPSPVKIRVYGTGFEGNVPIRVFKNGVKVAATQVTTMMGGFAEASTMIKLPPGTYELRAYNDNGKDATLLLWDTKTFTVT